MTQEITPNPTPYDGDQSKRVLVIDDTTKRIATGCELFGIRGRYILASSRGPSEFDENEYQIRYNPAFEGTTIPFERGDERLIARVLAEEPYHAILLDGNLGMRLEGEYFDGKVVARQLRNGVYGSLNKDTKIYSISSEGMSVIPHADAEFNLDRSMGSGTIPERMYAGAKELFES